MALDPDKLERIIGGDAEAGARVKALLTASDKIHKVIKIGDFELRINPAIPKTIRRELMRLSKLEDDPNVTEEQRMDEAERNGYKLLASVCIDPPFNREELWEEIDQDKGIIFLVLEQVTKAISESGEDIRRFR